MQLLLNRYLSGNPDPFFENQWSLKHLSSGINAQKMWDYGEKLKQERSVTIAIIDTGVDFNNKELPIECGLVIMIKLITIAIMELCVLKS